MWRCTWGAGHRIWGSVGSSGPRGSGAHGLCSLPAAPRPAGSWPRGSGQAPGGDLAGRWRAQSGFALDVKVPQDIILYNYDRHRTFFALGFFCIAQAGFWGYLAYLAFDSFRDPGEPQEGEKEKKKLRFPFTQGLEATLDAEKWRFGFTGACLAAGILIVGSASLFARRSIKQILLHQGGQEVSLTTYYPFGFTSTFTVPLRQVSCPAHRSQARAMVPVKVKKRSFYYVIDKQGEFTDANLFDLTVGAYREL
uniref:Transmembrane protein 223 n=1 Tax=Pogona vitticeps TaxID=103695 RepID=A0A6J0TWY5_9SAUR